MDKIVIGIEVMVRPPSQQGEIPKLEAVMRCSDNEIGTKIYEVIKEDLQKLVDNMAKE